MEEITGMVFARIEQKQDEYVAELEGQEQVSVETIENSNRDFNLGLDSRKIEWIAAHYDGADSSPVAPATRHQPTIAELMTFAQFHSEHCRHNTFRASWQSGKHDLPALLDLIRGTTATGGHNILSAYKDNAAVAKSYQESIFHPDSSGCYQQHSDIVHTVMKVETHNHPTAICPEPGAATGAGGELRDEAATGRGAKPVAGMVGYCIGNLYPEPDESYLAECPLAAAITIICRAPIGAATYNNEFGRPVLCGYFRSFEQHDSDGTCYSYLKPVMIAGGHGAITEKMVTKKKVQPGQFLMLMGGAALRVGIGGGSASSADTGNNDNDFNSVQRAHAQMQRRCQEVIDHCWQLGADNPILAIHDVGAGGIANAIPEILDGHGININVARVEVADKSMNALERWSNESQERFVFTIDPKNRDMIMELCQREQVPVSVLGMVSDDDVLCLRGRYQVDGKEEQRDYIHTSMRWLHTTIPEPARQLLPPPDRELTALPHPEEKLEQLVTKVLGHPTVGDKSFLVTIGDRSVGGLTAREQMVGPWQVAVSDCAISANNYDAFTGTAMAVGERPAIACTAAAASARMAIAEAISNLSAARILRLEDITLSANWMAAGGDPERESELYAAVKAACELCRELAIPIPVGKDSLSMRSRWQSSDNKHHEAISPLTLVATAFAPVADIRESRTPHIYPDQPLLLLEAEHGMNRLGGSILRQVSSNTIQHEIVPDCDATTIRAMFNTVQTLNDCGYLLAYHDRSDGGLLAALCEMAFAGNCGLEIELQQHDAVPQLFSEETGAVVQVPQEHCEQVIQSCQQAGLKATRIAMATANHDIVIRQQEKTIYSSTIPRLRTIWSANHKNIRLQRGDDTESVEQEQQAMLQTEPVLFSSLQDYQAPKATTYSSSPKVAILREQGINGHTEMAAAFTMAGFNCHDVQMSDLVTGRQHLKNYQVLAVPGGFSHADVLGAGRGWGMSILHQPLLREQFQDFFNRPDTLTLGLCNGCQMLATIKELIPGSEGWSEFSSNKSKRFEGRTVMVKVQPGPSSFLKNMEGWELPVPVAHGEGRISTADAGIQCLHYIDAQGAATTDYPANPAGSAAGIAGLCSKDGRVTILMPHPERAFLNWQLSWYPESWRGSESPWLQLFRNARDWVERN